MQTRVDPFLAAVIHGALENIAIEMGFKLMRMSYSPADQEERTFIMLEDTARYFRMMREWADREGQTVRILEELDIPPEQLSKAMAELDETIRAWADKYHVAGGRPVVLQMAVGSQEGSPADT